MASRWWQLVAAVIAMLMIANLQYAWTLFVAPIQAATGWHLPGIQWAFSLFILLQTWVQPLDGWLLDRWGPRRCISVAGGLCGIGWSLMGQATTLSQLYVFYAVAGVGAAFVYGGALGLAMRWFPDRRGTTAGIIAGAFGGGSALFIPVLSRLIEVHGYAGAFLRSGIVQGVVIVLAAQFLRYPDPAAAGVAPAAGRTRGALRRTQEHFATRQMVRTPQFLILYIMFVAMATGGLVVTANAAPLQRSWGLSPSALLLALTLGPIANAASRILWGLISDRAGRETTMAVAFSLQAVCLLGIVTLGRTSDIWFIVTLVLTFFTWGEIFALFPATLSDYFGTKHATANYGVLYTAKGVAAIIGGGLAALLFETFGTWSAVLFGSAVLALISAGLALALKATALPQVEKSPRG